MYNWKRIIYIIALTAVILCGVGLLIALVVTLTKTSDDNKPQFTSSAGSTTANPPPSTADNNSSAYGDYRYATVTSDTQRCSSIGVDILARHHGSAVDAAIATMLCVGVVTAQSSGIGGGHFMVIYDTPREGTEKVVTTITAREMAPLKSHRDMYNNDSKSANFGPLSIAVPGEVSGLYEAWRRFGRVPWSELFQPIIRLCEEGFAVEASMATTIKNAESIIRSDPMLRQTFVKPDDTLYEKGDIMKRPTLAATFRRIAEDPFTFYNGSLAFDIVADIQERGGIIQLEDLRQYKSKVKEPLKTTLKNGNYTVYGVPPPASGAIYQFILGILDGFNFKADDIVNQSKRVLTYHRMVEAFKFAYARRSDLGDEDYVNVTELVANLTSADFAASVRSQITDLSTQNVSYYSPSYVVKNAQGTSHLSVLAADGGAVSLTSTINLSFGSKVIGNRTNIIFNDQMDDFSIPGASNSFGVVPSPSNYIQPGKRPMSSTCPSLILNQNGDVIFSIGAAGGTRITTSTVFVTIHHLWFAMALNDAIDLPRIHHQLMPHLVLYESKVDKALLMGLEEKGHQLLSANNTNIGVVGAISNMCSADTKASTLEQSKLKCIRSVSDVRKQGAPDGY